MSQDHSRRLEKIGIVGTVLAALCCFTPILVVVLGAVGLGALDAYLDLVLLPTLLFFIGLTMYAVKRERKRCKKSSASSVPGHSE